MEIFELPKSISVPRPTDKKVMVQRNIEGMLATLKRKLGEAGVAASILTPDDMALMGYENFNGHTQVGIRLGNGEVIGLQSDFDIAEIDDDEGWQRVNSFIERMVPIVVTSVKQGDQ